MSDSLLGKATSRMTKALNVVRAKSVVEKHISSIEDQLENLDKEGITQIERVLADMRIRVEKAHSHAILAKAAAFDERNQVQDIVGNAATLTQGREYLIPDDIFGLYEYLTLASDDSLRIVGDKIGQERLVHVLNVLSEV